MEAREAAQRAKAEHKAAKRTRATAGRRAKGQAEVDKARTEQAAYVGVSRVTNTDERVTSVPRECDTWRQEALSSGCAECRAEPPPHTYLPT